MGFVLGTFAFVWRVHVIQNPESQMAKQHEPGFAIDKTTALVIYISPPLTYTHTNDNLNPQPAHAQGKKNNDNN